MDRGFLDYLGILELLKGTKFGVDRYGTDNPEYSVQGTNLQTAPHPYLPTNAQVQFEALPAGTLGQVETARPNTAFIDSWQTRGQGFINTLAHELGHIDQNNMGTPEQKWSPPHFTLGGGLWSMPAYETNVRDLPKEAKEGSAGNMNQTPREFMANLRGLEASMPAGKTIWDHPIAEYLVPTQTLSNNKANRQKVEAGMFPSVTRMYESEYDFSDRNLMDMLIEFLKLNKPHKKKKGK